MYENFTDIITYYLCQIIANKYYLTEYNIIKSTVYKEITKYKTIEFIQVDSLKRNLSLGCKLIEK